VQAFRRLDNRYSHLDAIRGAFSVMLDERDGMICSEFARDVLAALHVPDRRYLRSAEVDGRTPRRAFQRALLEGTI